jgi:hypothetical protein
MSSAVTNTITSGGQSISVFGNFNFKLFIYIMFAIVVEIAVIVYAVKAPMVLMLAIFIPLSLYIFLVYGWNWFGPGGPYTDTPVPWPPTLNSCPDFLVSYVIPANRDVLAIPGCVDTIGVSTKSADFPQRVSGVPNWPTAGAPTVAITPANASTYHSSGWFATHTGETTAALCRRLELAGLTWEGIWDGITCYSSGSAISGGGVNGPGTCD